MIGEHSHRTHSCLAKEWPKVFSTDQKPLYEESRDQLRIRLKADSNELRFFLRESESSTPSCQIEEIEEFYKVMAPVHAGTQPVRRNNTIWLDDRSNDKPARECTHRPELLTATELEQALRIPVYTQPIYQCEISG
jgi:hypothetical protein